MPWALAGQCGVAGCPNRSIPRVGLCKDHQRERWREDTKSRKDELRFYSTTQWKRLRHWYLIHYPLCTGCGGLAEMVDHIIPIRQGGSELDVANLQSLCNHCHAVKRAREQVREPADRGGGL